MCICFGKTFFKIKYCHSKKRLPQTHGKTLGGAHVEVAPISLLISWYFYC